MKVLQTSRQIRNQQLRDMGITPTASYQATQVGPGDHIEFCEVESDPLAPEERRSRAVVLAVHEHGWYLKVHVQDADADAVRDITLMRDGPPEWGVVEVRITKKVCEPQPEPEMTWRNGHDKRDVYYTPQGRMIL